MRDEKEIRNRLKALKEANELYSKKIGDTDTDPEFKISYMVDFNKNLEKIKLVEWVLSER